MAKEKFGVELPAIVLQVFDEWNEGQGYLKWKSVRAALQLFMCAPPDLREILMLGELDRLRGWFEDVKDSYDRPVFDPSFLLENKARLMDESTKLTPAEQLDQAAKRAERARPRKRRGSKSA